MGRSGSGKATVWLLAATTLASGFAAIYYARAFQREAALATRQGNTLASPSGGPVDIKGQPAATAVVPAAAAAADAPPGTVEREAGPLDPGQIAVARHQLEQLRDPAVRAKELQKRIRHQHAMLREMAPYAGFTEQEMEPLAEAMANALLDLQLRGLECEADPGCNRRALLSGLEKAAEEDFIRLMGPERAARVRAYNDTFDERMNLQLLSDRLPAADALSTDQIARLSMALADERKRFDGDAEARSEKVEPFTDGGMGVVQLRSAAVPGASDEATQRLESATNFSARQRRHAANVLSGAALAAFDGAQENTLAAYKMRLERKAAVDP